MRHIFYHFPYSPTFAGGFPIRWPAQRRVASLPELDRVGNPAEYPSSGCHGAPAMGRVWSGRNQRGGAPLLVQCFTGSPSCWTEAGAQLCRGGPQCPEAESSKCPQCLHTQLGQHKTLTHTSDWTRVRTHARTHTCAHTHARTPDQTFQMAQNQNKGGKKLVQVSSCELFVVSCSTHTWFLANVSL